MPDFDSRLTLELERVARPADPTGVLDRLDERRARRATMRKARAVFLAVAVLGATTVGFVALRAAFREGTQDTGNPPQLSGNGDIVVSTVGKEGRMQLFVARPDGSGVRVLTLSGPFDDLHPSISPDGTTVVFQRRLDGAGFVIASVPIAGGTVTELTVRALVLEPAWSPDGDRIAFAGSFDDDALGLWVMDADGSNPRRIAGSGSFDTMSPSWSPDGSRIAFVGFDDDAGLLDDIYSVTAEGADLTRLTDTPALHELSPAWSPDGRTIAFARSGDGMEDSEIWTIRPDGSSPILVDRAPMSFMDQLVWSPDATALLASFHGWVHLVDLEEGGFVRLVEGTTAAWQPLPAGSEPVEEPRDDPRGRDIGLPFRVCRVDTLLADFDGDGQRDTAYVVNRVERDACPQLHEYRQRFFGIDLDRDGRVDVSRGPLRCDPWCVPFAAPDLNRDGRAELLVNEGHLASPVSALIGVYGIDGSSLRPIRFPSGSNRFMLEIVASVPSYAGAYCFSDGEERVFSLWTASPPVAAPRIHDVTQRVFVIDVEAFTFTLADTRSSPVTNDSLPPSGIDGKLCGVETAQIG